MRHEAVFRSNWAGFILLRCGVVSSSSTAFGCGVSQAPALFEVDHAFKLRCHFEHHNSSTVGENLYTSCGHEERCFKSNTVGTSSISNHTKAIYPSVCVAQSPFAKRHSPAFCSTLTPNASYNDTCFAELSVFIEVPRLENILISIYCRTRTNSHQNPTGSQARLNRRIPPLGVVGCTFISFQSFYSSH